MSVTQHPECGEVERAVSATVAAHVLGELHRDGAHAGTGAGQGLSDEALKKLGERAKKAIKEKQDFERVVLTKEEALELQL